MEGWKVFFWLLSYISKYSLAMFTLAIVKLPTPYNKPQKGVYFQIWK